MRGVLAILAILLVLTVPGCTQQEDSYPVKYKGDVSIKDGKLLVKFERQSDVIPELLKIRMVYRKELSIRNSAGELLPKTKEGSGFVSTEILADREVKEGTYEFMVSGGEEGVSGYRIEVSMISYYGDSGYVHFKKEVEYRLES